MFRFANAKYFTLTTFLISFDIFSKLFFLSTPSIPKHFVQHVYYVFHQNRAYLLDLPELGHTADATLTRIFADPTILKVGRLFCRVVGLLSAR
jgi:hypothetical protein